MNIALVAGEGLYPYLFAERVKSLGHRLTIITFSGYQTEGLVPLADAFYEIRIGQLGRLLRLLKREKVEEVAFAGAINKPRALWEARPDWRAWLLWRRLKARHDDHILRGVAEEIERLGIRVISPTVYLPELITPEGVLTRRRPTRNQWEDVIFGYSMAKALGELDIGQCLVVKDKMVVAVEAMEGTDATIRRAGDLVQEAVVVKVCKPKQDPRFDLPSAGARTIETMLEAGAKVLVLEAKRSLFFERERALALADEAGMVVIGVSHA